MMLGLDHRDALQEEVARGLTSHFAEGIWLNKLTPKKDRNLHPFLGSGKVAGKQNNGNLF
jgi:hypothetical protein